MAGGGSGEEENYWPGFVDALTTMVMVLTFIMMILGVVVFSMSQNISKQLVQQIAEAAQVDAKVGGTAEEVKEQIIAAIKASRAAKVDQEDAKEKTQEAMRGEARPQPAPTSNPSERTVLPAPAQAEQEKDAKKAAGGSPTQEPKIGEQSDKKSPSPPSPIKEEPGKTEPDKRIESSKITDVDVKNSGVSISDAGSILTVAFKKRVVQLDEPAIDELNRLVKSSRPLRSANRLEVKGYADVSVLGVTEARRIAYYRTMLIRKQLLNAGFDAERITVRIEDAPAAEGDLVKVFAR